MSTAALPQLSAKASQALQLLGNNVAPHQVAAALGVTESYISQLLSEAEFSAKVAELRFASLQKHNARDAKYDELEDDLVDRLRDCMPLMHRPLEILKAIQVINAAKRRGSSAPESLHQQHNIVTLNMPTQIINKFSVNVNNQVVQAGSQDLLTIQSGSLLDSLKSKSSGVPNHERAALTVDSKAT